MSIEFVNSFVISQQKYEKASEGSLVLSGLLGFEGFPRLFSDRKADRFSCHQIVAKIVYNRLVLHVDAKAENRLSPQMTHRVGLEPTT